ncbi:hypothetical protein JKP88DRAFT_243300 [Tribonema minus]|uniref:Uncharacterized protein n=1 Tax=Tribonema minus TaxID=303371 RepID=A0A836CKV4_9STRA|nr:hypothetical protein JKP88DRAFT_243300 [Tribonema minus]
MSISAQQPNDSNVYVSSLWTTRTGDYHNDVEITLPRPIIAADGYSLKMSILSLTIASTQMAVNVYTNSLTISGITATLTPGNYSATVLAAALTSLFPTRSVAFNTLTSKKTFSSATSMVISGSMCDILGISQGASGLVISSQQNVDLSGNDAIYVYTSLSVDSLNAAQVTLAYPQSKAVAVSAVSSKFSNVPVSGSFSGGQVVSIDIAGSGQRSCWLDPSATILNFTVTVNLNGGTAPTWASHGYSFIQSLNLYASAGSTQIESVAQYNALHAALRDCCTSQDMVRTRDSITLGADPTRLRSPVPNVYSTTTTATYSPLRLDIELASAASAIASGGTAAATSATYAITGVTLDCEYITLADDAHRSICALTNNQFAWSSSQWKTYRTVHMAGAMSNAIMIPSRVSSMKSLLIAQREAAAEFDLSKSSVTQRLRNNLKQYQVRCGSQYINATPVSATGTALPAYIEAVKVFSNPASESGCGLFASDSWALDTNVAPTSSSMEGSFIIGVELEAFSQNAKLISGHSTSANSLVAEIAFASTPLGVNIDCFLMSDGGRQCLCGLNEHPDFQAPGRLCEIQDAVAVVDAADERRSHPAVTDYAGIKRAGDLGGFELQNVAHGRGQCGRDKIHSRFVRSRWNVAGLRTNRKSQTANDVKRYAVYAVHVQDSGAIANRKPQTTLSAMLSMLSMFRTQVAGLRTNRKSQTAYDVKRYAVYAVHVQDSLTGAIANRKPQTTLSAMLSMLSMFRTQMFRTEYSGLIANRKQQTMYSALLSPQVAGLRTNRKSQTANDVKRYAVYAVHVQDSGVIANRKSQTMYSAVLSCRRCSGLRCNRLDDSNASVWSQLIERGAAQLSFTRPCDRFSTVQEGEEPDRGHTTTTTTTTRPVRQSETHRRERARFNDFEYDPVVKDVNKLCELTLPTTCYHGDKNAQVHELKVVIERVIIDITAECDPRAAETIAAMRSLALTVAMVAGWPEAFRLFWFVVYKRDKQRHSQMLAVVSVLGSWRHRSSYQSGATGSAERLSGITLQTCKLS